VSADWREHLRPTLRDLGMYDVEPADASLARMHANECPEPWPAEVMDAVAATVRHVELGRYPDTSGRRLRALLGERFGCAPDRVVLGNGSDEVITLLLIALSGRSGPVVYPMPTFVMYGHRARVLGLPLREVPVDDTMQLREDAMDEALEGAAICFLARPNNPTGALWDRGIIERLMQRHPGTVFVIDEAYIDYAPGESMWQPDAPANFVLMGTLSKIGLAALRVGYCIAPPELAAPLHVARDPYNVSATSLAIAEVVLTRFADAQNSMIARTLANRRRLEQLLASIPGAVVFPSAANLVLCRLADANAPAALCERLREVGVLLKDVSRAPGLDRCIRASVGTSDDLDRLEDALRRSA
jgi:histidinol-phosphate aminotransferase